MKKSHFAWLAIPALAVALAGCGSKQADYQHNHAQSSTNVVQSTKNMNSSTVSSKNTAAHVSTTTVNHSQHAVVSDQNAEVQKLAQLNYQSGANPIVQVNGGKSNLSMQQWKNNSVQYSHLDHLNRTSSPSYAYLEQRNIANDSLRTQQTVRPTGWHQKFNAQHEAILNRGHIIAYSLSKGITDQGNYDPSQQSGDQNNPRNLFTQTAFCNQELQTIYESKVRDALRQGAKVVYRVQPIFQGNDLMAKGVWMQAIGSNGLNFNVYLYNVQPGYQFNYTNGTSVVDAQMRVPTPPNAPHFDNQGHSEWHDHSWGHHLAEMGMYHAMHHAWHHHQSHWQSQPNWQAQQNSDNYSQSSWQSSSWHPAQHHPDRHDHYRDKDTWETDSRKKDAPTQVNN